jgi:hypothetical protein
MIEFVPAGSVNEDDTGKYIPDVRSYSISKARFITSRKRTRNMLDLTNSWKRIVLKSLDADASNPLEEESSSRVDFHPTSRPANVGEDDSEKEIIIHKRERSPNNPQWDSAYIGTHGSYR